MALMIGELVGYLDLDAGPFEQGIGKAFDMLGDKKWQVAGAAAGVAAATALAGGLVMAVDAEGALNKVSAALGLTKDESAKAGTVAGKLFADNYGDSMEDVTGAVEAVMSSISGMRDASAEDIQAMTGHVMNLASAFDIDVAQAALSAGQMVTNGLAKDGVGAADLLTAALQKVPAELRGDVLDATNEYGKHFKQLGIGGPAAMDLIVQASAQGAIGIDKIGDAFKEFGIRASDIGDTGAQEALESIGLSGQDMANDILAGGDTAQGAFQKIIGGLASIEDPATQAAASTALFGTQFEDLGKDNIPELLKAMSGAGDSFGDVGGKVTELGDTLNSGAGASIKTFTRTAQQTLSDLGASVLPILTPILQNLSQWAPVVGPLVLALGAFGAVIWVVTAAMAAFSAVKGIIAAIKGWTVVQWLLNTAMSANVIGLIVIGIAALIAAIVLLVMNWDTVVAFLKGAWDGFVSWFMGIMDGFLSWWSGIWGGFLGFWSDTFNNAKAAAVAIWTGIVDWVKGIPGKIVQALVALALLHIKFGLWILSVKDAAVAKFLDIVNWVKGIPGMILNGLLALARLHVQFGLWILSVKDAAVAKFLELVGWVGGLPGRILSALGSLGSLLWGAGGQIIQGFLDGLKQGFENVKNFVGGIGQWIADHKGPKAYDLALLVPAGGWIMTGLTKGLERFMPNLGRTLGDISWMIQNGIDPELGINGSYAFSGIKANLPASARQTPPTTVYNQTFNVEKADGVDAETQARGMAEQIMWKG